jgi:hypothetical protein
MEAPYVIGDDIPYYNVTEERGRGGTKKILHVLPPPPEEPKKIEVTADFGEKKQVILAAKARACIDLVAPTIELVAKDPGKVKGAYTALVKMVHGELDRL